MRKIAGRYNPFKVGEIVALCYDGKSTRAVEGLVVDAHEDYIKVKFKPWANEEAGFIYIKCYKEPWVFGLSSIKKIIEYGWKWCGWVTGEGENGIIAWLGGYGDYYRVHKCKELIDDGYEIKSYDRPTKIYD